QTGGTAFFIQYTLSNALPHLVNGANVLTIQAFNQSLGGSPDFGFNAQLFGFTSSSGFVAPTVVQADPPQGDTLALTNVLVVFNEDVTGVDASDLLINGTPATAVERSGDTGYKFSFTQPPF